MRMTTKRLIALLIGAAVLLGLVPLGAAAIGAANAPTASAACAPQYVAPWRAANNAIHNGHISSVYSSTPRYNGNCSTTFQEFQYVRNTRVAGEFYIVFVRQVYPPGTPRSAATANTAASDIGHTTSAGTPAVALAVSSAPLSLGAQLLAGIGDVKSATGTGYYCWWVPTYYNWFRGGYVNCGRYQDKPWWAN